MPPVVQELKLKQSLLLDTMATVTTQATQEEKVVHMDMLKKTDSNVKKLANKLCKRSWTTSQLNLLRRGDGETYLLKNKGTNNYVFVKISYTSYEHDNTISPVNTLLYATHPAGHRILARMRILRPFLPLGGQNQLPPYCPAMPSNPNCRIEQR